MRDPNLSIVQFKASKSFVRTVEDIVERLGCSKSEFLRRAALEQAKRDYALLTPTAQ